METRNSTRAFDSLRFNVPGPDFFASDYSRNPLSMETSAEAVLPASSVPIILQGETSECGLASLAMIASAWGLKVELAALRSRVSATPRGINLRMLIDLASGIGLAARPVRIGLKRLSDLKLPCVLHWKMDHFVVLERVTSDSVWIVDPGRGRMRMCLEAVSPNFTGVAVEFTPTASFEPGVIRLSRSFRRVWLDDRDLRSAAFRSLWLAVLVQASIVALPFAYRSLIDQAGDLNHVSGHPWWIALGIGLMVVVQAGSTWVRGLVVARLGSIFVHRVATSVVSRMFALPVSFFHRHLLGDILSRVRSVEVLRRFLTDQAASFVIDMAVGLVTALLMISFSLHLALIVIVGLMLDAAVRLVNLRRGRTLSEDLLLAESKELVQLLESMRAIQAIKLAGREAQRFAMWENELVRVLNANVRLNRQHTGVATVASVIGTFEWALVLAVGILGIGHAPVTLGVLFGFLAYRAVFRERLTNVLENIWSLQTAQIHLRRLDDLMLADAEPKGGPLTSCAGSGTLKFENIAFRYAATEPLVFSDVSLEIPSGACVAIVGSSGSGKSTLVKLILGIETPQTGNIRLDDVSIEDVELRVWRDRFGVVMQDDTLLAGSISDNIAFFDAQVDMDRVRQAARSAAIHEEVSCMPMEYATMIGDMGAQISGGQRQRILIARALYRKPSLIVFDEGTANLDAASEMKIAHVLDELTLTRIIVAHRSHLLDVADIVYEIIQGRVRRVR